MARILIDAILSGDETLAYSLIQNGTYGCIDSQTARRDGTALFFCCSRGYTKIALLLIERGANVNSQNKFFSTPLHAAADCGYVDIVSMLLQEGAEVNCKNNRGDTPLHLAAYRGHLGVIYCLVRHGADLLALNSHQITAQIEARGQGHEQLATFLMDQERAQHPSTVQSGVTTTMLTLNPPEEFASPGQTSSPLAQEPSADRRAHHTVSFARQRSDSDVKPPSRRRHSHSVDFHYQDSTSAKSLSIPREVSSGSRRPVESTWTSPPFCLRRPSLCSTGSDSLSSDVSQCECRREEDNWISPSPSPVSDSSDCPRRSLSLNNGPALSLRSSHFSLNSCSGHQAVSTSSSGQYSDYGSISSFSMPSWASMDPPSSSDLSSAMSTGSDDVVRAAVTSSTLQPPATRRGNNLSLVSPAENQPRVALTRAVSVHGQSEPSHLTSKMLPFKSRVPPARMPATADASPDVNDLSSLPPPSLLSNESRDMSMTYINIPLS